MGAEARKESDQKRRFMTEEALDDAGYILTHVNAVVEGYVNKVDADGEAPVGVNLMSTDNPITGVAVADVMVTVLDSGDAWVKLTPNANRSNAIVVGDWLKSHTDGMALLNESTIATVANMDMSIGIALQGVALDSDTPTAGEEPYREGYILVKLRPRGA